MRTVEELIGDLLLRHNCVIVPGFGGFVAKQASARIDYNSGKMLPPVKSLLFNRQLINNDGLLINEHATTNQVSYNDSSIIIGDLVKKWNGQLDSGQRIELDRIGHLYFDSEKNLCFEQDRFFNLLLDSFGLGEVQFTPEVSKQKVELKPEMIVSKTISPVIAKELPKEEKSEKPIIPIEPSKTAEEKNTGFAVTTHSRNKVWRYIAAACIIPVAFYSVWIPMKTDVLESGIISLSDFNPFHDRHEGLYEKEDLKGFSTMKTPASLEEQMELLEGDAKVYTYAYDDTHIAIERESLTEEIETDSEIIVKDDITINSDLSESASAMHFIVGCFSVGSNAQNLVSKLKSQGFDARIVDVHNGLNRVSAGGAISLESIADVKARAQAAGFNGWILK